MRQLAKNNFVEWDVKTVTAGDYSIEFDITAAFYEAFEKTVGVERMHGKTLAQHFKIWIQQEMEKKLSKLEDLGFEDTPVDEIHVAVTTLAFDNAELINLLKTRGTLIRTEKWDKVREIDNKINELKKEKLEVFVRPCSVFMSFETEEGVQRALDFDRQVTETDDQSIKDLKTWVSYNGVDHEIEIQAASEPSDIIWENRHFTPQTRFKKTIITVIVIGLALFASFCTIFAGRQYQYKVINTYPKVDCDYYETTYGDSLQF